MVAFWIFELALQDSEVENFRAMSLAPPQVLRGSVTLLVEARLFIVLHSAAGKKVDQSV